MFRKINQKYIADLLNISRVTVTKALQNHPDIALSTREKVKKVADELGYIPNIVGRSLSTKKTNTIGVIVPKINHSFFSTIIEELYSNAKKVGYNIILMVSFENEEAELDNVKVPASNLIGELEGQGLKQILAGLELGRINVAARGVGVSRAALEDSIEYAKVRKTFGKPISEHQSIQIKLAEMATRLEASRLLTEQAAKAYDSGNRSDLQAGMAKLFATETALFNSTEAMRIHGGFGYSPEYNIERYYRDAPLLAIGEGTNELQKLIIAKQLVSDN